MGVLENSWPIVTRKTKRRDTVNHCNPPAHVPSKIAPVQSFGSGENEYVPELPVGPTWQYVSTDTKPERDQPNLKEIHSRYYRRLRHNIRTRVSRKVANRKRNDYTYNHLQTVGESLEKIVDLLEDEINTNGLPARLTMLNYHDEGVAKLCVRLCCFICLPCLLCRYKDAGVYAESFCDLDAFARHIN